MTDTTATTSPASPYPADFGGDWKRAHPTAEQLAEILRLHKGYLLGRPEGVRADLRNADLSNADLSYADLSNADLSNADLSNADLSNADLSNADLSNADLRNADLSNADLSNADLSYADLRNADLSNADLSNADLSNADLSNADLSNADLSNADLSYADLSNADLSDQTVLPDGLIWKRYVEELVPALLTAGGKKLEEVANERVWSCHSWGRPAGEVACPIASAFGVHSPAEVPILYLERANFFIQIFDQGLIPLHRVLGLPAPETPAPAGESAS